jgi:ABC-type sugar transport system permease subunit
MASVSEVEASVSGEASVSAIDAGRSRPWRQSLLRSLRSGLQGSEYTWALAFLVPYVAVFLAFVVYPLAYGFWMGSEPSLYPQVFSDPIYQKTVVNTLVIFLAGRMAIPKEILEAAEVDGCTGLRRFVHITVPMLANLYLVATLLLTIFLMGDFNTVNFITGGGPAMSTNVLATLGINQYTLAMANPRLGVAALLTALPLLIPLVIILMRRLRAAQVQL